MAKIHRSRRRDDNEPAIVRALEGIGCSVTRLDGAGVPDLLVGIYRKTVLLEVKEPLGPRGGLSAHRDSEGGQGELTRDQVTWWASWKGARATIVRSPEQALGVIAAIIAGGK